MTRSWSAALIKYETRILGTSWAIPPWPIHSAFCCCCLQKHDDEPGYLHPSLGRFWLNPSQPQSPVIPAGNRGLVLDFRYWPLLGPQIPAWACLSCPKVKPTSISLCLNVTPWTEGSGFAEAHGHKNTSDAYHQQQTLGAKEGLICLNPINLAIPVLCSDLGPAVNLSPDHSCPQPWAALRLVPSPSHSSASHLPAPLKIILGEHDLVFTSPGSWAMERRSGGLVQVKT